VNAQTAAEPSTDTPLPSPPSFTDALKTWALIGVTSFGGPAGQIALMHKILVEEKRWLSERTYLIALNFCTLLPGPEAMQLATYAGWRLHGTLGGLAAGLLFVLPGALIILVLSALYALYGTQPLVSAAFLGIKAAVLAIVIEALLRISRRSLKHGAEWAIAALAFIAIYFFKVPFPLIVLAAGVTGYLFLHHTQQPDAGAPSTPIPLRSTFATAATWLAIWIAPLLAIAAITGMDHVLVKLALFFSKLAVVTFGGAYAVLAYVAQDAVQHYGWLQPGEMLDGLGLAETTPGPLILVNEFVGFLAGFRSGSEHPLVMGVLGALVVLWSTFVPCFLWIFTGAPYIERIAGMPRLKSALSAITAAVTGVILNLSVWFALHVIFARVPEAAAGPLRFSYPDLSSIDWLAATLAIFAAVMLFKLQVGMLRVLAISAALALSFSAVF
jgi:chromate transporter